MDEKTGQAYTMDFGRRRGKALANRIVEHQCNDACQRIDAGIFEGLWVHADARIPKEHIAIDGVIVRLTSAAPEET